MSLYSWCCNPWAASSFVIMRRLGMLYVVRARLSSVLHLLALHQSSYLEARIYAPTSTFHWMWMTLAFAIYPRMASKQCAPSRLLQSFRSRMKFACNTVSHESSGLHSAEHHKVGCPVMLPRNLDPSRDHCNGIRLLIRQSPTHILEGCI